ncbi:solute carrier family 22 member 6-like protein [Dinothrombium tinctorium]|uniref:Solute carrier family 22 member 6-like protein n=1 Tax=Dinothrombium tinctorium TaxID=1965070 RepID=A0A3S3P1A3_9ACAR|nr:solute carrier family 22 member 6-like protein [Dinothrombium tinctorium]
MNREKCDETEDASTIEATKHYTIEQVFEQYVGEFGNYQKLLTLYVWIVIAPLTGILLVSSLLILLIPPHWCKYQAPNVTEISINESSTDWHSYNIPRKSDGSGFESCFIHGREVNSSNESVNILKCKDGWKYDHSLVIVTAASENDWVCDNQWKALLPHSVFSIGMTLGGIVIGILSDTIGRIPTIALGYSIAGIAGLLTNFTSEHYTLFVAARAVLGAATPAMMVPLVIRLFLTMYTCGGVLPWIAYAIGKWRTYNLITSSCFFLVPLLSIFTLESPRWLLAVGKNTKASDILARLARINGRKIPNSILMNIQAPNTSQAPLKHIFKYKIFLRTFLLSSTIALLYTMIFAGHNIFVANLSKHPFMMLSVFAGFDCVAAVLSRFVADFYGRRKSMCFACFLSAILYSITVFIPKDLDRLIIAVAFSARMGITALMNINAVYSSEIFPTVARSRLSSVRMCISSFGTAFSPILVSFQFFGSNTPLFLFGILVAVCGFLMLPMPETLGKPLPETFEDAEKLNIKSNESQKENNESDDILLQKV